MSILPRSILVAACAFVLAMPGVSWAQSADATLRGRAPAQANVTAKNIATGATRRTKASADGSYTLTGLPPGTYRVDVGPGTETTVTLTVASTATLDLAAGGAATSGAATAEAPIQEIRVEGRRLHEVRTSEVGTTVSQQQIETVPQMTRNFLEFADTVPGIVFEVDSNGKTSIRGGAQNNNGVNLYIDGVGQKGYVRSGVSGQAGDTQGNPFPQLAIGEYKVITSNYKAEYDQLSSAAITALSRSGTNSFEGQAFGTYSSDNWRARTPGELASDTKTESETKEYGLAFGGPIIEDQLHFFFAYEAKRYQTPITVLAAGSAPPDVVGALPADVLAQLGPAEIAFKEDLIFAKFDYESGESDRFELSAKIRDEASEGDRTGTGTAGSAAIDTDNNDKRFAFSWKHGADRWFNELQLTYEDVFYTPHVRGGANNGAIYTWFNGGGDENIIAVDGGDPRAGQNKGQKGWGIANDVTFSDIHWLGGEHTIKTGIKYKDIDLTAQDAVVNNPVFFYDVTLAGAAAIPWKTIFALPLAGFSSLATSNDKQLGLFAQDDWTVNDHLTLNLGLRWDVEWNSSYLDFAAPQFLLDSLNTEFASGITYGESLSLSPDPNVHFSINDYLSNGSNREAYKDAIQPRLGFSYDIGSDQNHVIFGGAGRAYDRTLYDYLQLEQTKFALAQAQVLFNTADHPCTVNGTGCVNWDPAFATDIANLQALLNGQAGEVDLMNNDLKVPYSDQFSLGIRNRLGDWQTSASVSRILSKDGFVFTLGNRFETGAFWQNRGQPFGNSPPGLAGLLLLGNNGIETRSTQVLLSAEKPFTEESRWGTTFAYTYTDAEQNRDINEHYSFDASSINAYPFILSNAASKHRVVATGSFAAPWGLKFAAKLTWSSPVPRNVLSFLNAPATFPSGAPGTAFAYVPDGKGYQALDLQLTKNFEIGAGGSMYLRMDALNVTNEHNLLDTVDEHGPDGLVTGGHFFADGNITGFPRTIRMSFGVKY